MARAHINSPWTDDQVEELKSLLYKGRSLATLAVHFRRRPGGLIRKLSELGLPTPAKLSTIPSAGTRKQPES